MSETKRSGGMRSSIAHALRRCKNTLSKITHRTLEDLDDMKYAEKYVDSLFESASGKFVTSDSTGAASGSVSVLAGVNGAGLFGSCFGIGMGQTVDSDEDGGGGGRENDNGNNVNGREKQVQRVQQAQQGRQRGARVRRVGGVLGGVRSKEVDEDSGASQSQLNVVNPSNMLETKLSEDKSYTNSTTSDSEVQKVGSLKEHEGETQEDEATAEEEKEKEENGKESILEEQEVDTFSTYDPVKECEKLRSRTEGPFYHAERIFDQRRILWQAETNGMTPEKIARRRAFFKEIPEEYYAKIYKKLVVDDKPLKKPLNLADAMKVIESGWGDHINYLATHPVVQGQ